MTESLTISTGEAVLFWILAPLMVIGALGLVFSKRIVHIAVAVAGVMIGLAVMYAANEASFLAVGQVVVYTGAVMMLFLFVIMLIGVDTSESLTETLPGQRWWAVLAGVGTLVLLVAVTTRASLPEPVGLSQANADGNPTGVARLIFSDFVFPFELTGALLITAALGAITLTHRMRLSKKVGQPELAAARMRAYGAGESSATIAVRPGPGVYARHNSADMPAIDAQGRPIDESVSSVLRVRGQFATPPVRLELGRGDATEISGPEDVLEFPTNTETEEAQP